MDTTSLLAVLILFATAGTVIVGMIVYATYKLRARQLAKEGIRGMAREQHEPIFLKLYVPEGEAGGVKPQSFLK